MQNVGQTLAGLVFLATFAVPGIDKRWDGHTRPASSYSLATR